MTLPDTPQMLYPDGHPPLEQLRLYHEDALPPTARHQVEKHLLTCDLCADVLTGITISDRMPTQVALTDLKQQIRKRVQQQPETQSSYIPFLRVAAVLLLLLVSVGIFKFWQQSNLAPAPESTTAGSYKSQPESIATVPALPNPVLKPAGPAPATRSAGRIRPPARRKAWPKVNDAADVTTVSPDAEDLFPVDTAVIMDAIAAQPADTHHVARADASAQQNIPPTVEAKRVAAPVAGKQMGVVVQGNSTFTGQTVSGTVLDATTNQGLPGVIVAVKGTPSGTTTDAQGNFSLAVPTGKDELVFSFIGYNTQEQKVKPSDNQLAVKLSADSRQLSEVVVTGYGKPENISIEIIRARPQAGRKAYNRYIRDNLRYPVVARQQKLEGKVEVGFTVTAEGELTDFKILKSLNPDCDAEAIRVIKEGPAWQPARLQNQPQSENARLTVHFKLK